ncbi:hypothetical protein [Burkholderia ubonensis]|uniref:hypothetical protein n=1 Tax=Burkholderia ubonensis TaxID=101571 RepID=UPI000A5D8307|nr:hypothetical protein [Burkholderia ubonensis]
MSTEIARKQSGSEGLVYPYPPTTGWAPLSGGSVQPQNLIAPIYLNGKIYAFARSSSDTLTVCTISYTAKAGDWTSYTGYTFYASATASPAVALAGAGSDHFAVAFLTSQSSVQVGYIPVTDLKNPKSPAYIGGLPMGSAFAGPVKLVRNANGYLEAFALDRAGNMWSAIEKDRNIPATWGVWSQIPGGRKLDSSVKDFKAFLLATGSNQGCIQVVALGGDGKMYQSTEKSGQFGYYAAFALLGKYDGIKESSRFIMAPAVTFDPSSPNNQFMVYAAYNENPTNADFPMDRLLNNSSSAKWEFITDFKATGPQPLLTLSTTADQVTHLTWIGVGGQVYLTSRNSEYPRGGVSYWSGNAQSVGAADPSFTGNVAVVVNDNNVGLFQPRADGVLSFINFLPT